jgi:hypothetical protein
MHQVTLCYNNRGTAADTLLIGHINAMFTSIFEMTGTVLIRSKTGGWQQTSTASL